LEEISYDENIQFILTYKDNLWNKILPKGLEDTEWVDIATYNFNFKSYGDGAFYEKLRKIANNGDSIRLIFQNATDEEIKVDKFFANSVYCRNNKQNHAKIFLTENLGYIGSANFSFGSNNNYECGILIKSKNVIKDIRNKIFLKLLAGEEITLPYPYDILDKVKQLLSLSNELLNALDTTYSENRSYEYNPFLEEELYNYYEILYKKEYLHQLDNLGFESYEVDELRNKFSLDFDGHNYDFLGFAIKLQDDSYPRVSDEEFHNFHKYLRDLNKFCNYAKFIIEITYANLGKEKFTSNLEPYTDEKLIRKENMDKSDDDVTLSLNESI
jgi:hypothetical protein